MVNSIRIMLFPDKNIIKGGKISMKKVFAGILVLTLVLGMVAMVNAATVTMTLGHFGKAAGRLAIL